MKKAICVFCFLLSASTALAVEDPNFDIKQYCQTIAEAGGGSAVIERACRKEESAIKKRIGSIEASAKSTRYCKEIAAALGAGSYQIFEACLREEAGAERDLEE